MTAGKTGNSLSQSLFALCTQMTSAMGNPQNSAERPRASWPRELSSSGWGPGTPRASDGEVGVFLESTLIVVKQAHRFRGLEFVGFDGLVHLRLHLPLQFVFVVLHVRERLDD